MSELAQSMGLAGPDIRRELSQLADADIIKQWRDGNRVYFAANTQCPFFPELRRLLLKTAGLIDVLKESLQALSDYIELAFVYGSFARGTDRSASDVDVLIVGTIDPIALSEKLHKAEEVLQRDINTSVFAVEEFCARVEQGDHFLTSVLEGEKIFILGSEDDLEALTGNKAD